MMFSRSGAAAWTSDSQLGLPPRFGAYAQLKPDGRLLVLADRAGSPALNSWLADMRQSGHSIDLVPCSAQDLEEGDAAGDLEHGAVNDVAELPAARRMRAILAEAVARGASDVHLTLVDEPRRGHVSVEFRIDGELEKMAELSQEEGERLLRASYQGLAEVADRSVVESDDQHAVISDRAFLTAPDGHPLPLVGVRLARAAIVRGSRGQALAARLLYAHQEATIGSSKFRELGYSARQVQSIRRMVLMPDGLQLMSGPTGSGKSTTLAAMIQAILEQRAGVRIITIEDPVEHQFNHDRVWQYRIANAETEEEKSRVFAAKLKTALRQDPEVIMVGEIRGIESAREALNAALTGHLVPGTLHVKDPFMIPQRLAAMGIPDDFLIDPRLLRALVSQRLVRTICPHCAPQPWRADDATVEPADVAALQAWAELSPFGDCSGVRLRGTGCSRCGQRGTLGRTVLAQVLLCDEVMLRDMIEHGSAAARRNYQSRPDAELDMQMHGVLKVLAGQLDPRDLIAELDQLRAPLPGMRPLSESDL